MFPIQMPSAGLRRRKLKDCRDSLQGGRCPPTWQTVTVPPENSMIVLDTLPWEML